ncbi:hypothetical protein FW778_17890 [Ginsengibacter hankyongi]|uniref:Uncharacterized protein n=1 Tax=Ginsengibacter hankyongi TaxID=2607284 RepID=A0A5J5IFB8_9BACT|nr:hypothetical protein [Ginsengibacter hankyongi]KAA9037297.1 hypothetical protein FW778_17890 [Ginsengibacter hankyongi]
MSWTTKSNEAKNLAASGADHLMNAEFAQAYSDILAAVKLNPDFTIAFHYRPILRPEKPKKCTLKVPLKVPPEKRKVKNYLLALPMKKYQGRSC